MAITLGAYYPTRNLMEGDFSEALTKIAILFKQAKLGSSGECRDPIKVALSFLLCSGDDRPEFSGMFISKFNEDDDIVELQSVVPEHILGLGLCEQYILAAIRDAIDNANEFLSSNNRFVSTQTLHSTVERVEKMLTAEKTIQFSHV